MGKIEIQTAVVKFFDAYYLDTPWGMRVRRAFARQSQPNVHPTPATPARGTNASKRSSDMTQTFPTVTVYTTPGCAACAAGVKVAKLDFSLK
jgi:hypothetical protein